MILINKFTNIYTIGKFIKNALKLEFHMKDLAHHLKKLNSKILRAFHKEEAENKDLAKNLPSPPQQKQTEREMKKIKKREALKIREERTPLHLSKEEKNKKMKQREPVFGKTNKGKLNFNKASKKKTPKI